nr:ATP-binding cassette transporter Abca3-like4 [Brachionus angularis]
MKNQKIVSFFRQVIIISWKNLLLYRQNKTGIVCEIIFSCLFTLIFVLLVYYSAPMLSPKSNYKQSNVINTLISNDLLNTSNFYFYPNNLFIQKIITESFEIIKAKNSYLKLNIIGTNFDSPEILDETIRKKLFAFVSFAPDFGSSKDPPDTIQYKLYTIESSLIYTYHTSDVFLPKKKYLYENSPEYFCQNIEKNYVYKYSAFNTIKHAIDLSLIKALTQVELTPDTVKIAAFNCPEYINDLLKSYLSFLTPVLISLAFLVTFLVTISSIITEKETKMKEYLRLVGVDPLVIWLCWMLRSYVIYLLISTVVTITSTIKFDYKKSQSDFLKKKSLFLYTDSWIIFMTCNVYSIQVTSLSLLIGQIFNRTFPAKTLSIVLWFITLINFFNSYSSVFKYFFSIFPNSALNFAIQIIYQYERSGKKLNLFNLYKNLLNDELNLGALLASMLVWSFVYLLASWYIEKISPGEFGIKQPWNFIFKKSYWNENKTDKIEYNNEELINEENYNDSFEREPIDLNASVRIKNLTKVFRTGFEDKIAVDNLSLNFYENQITGFLGHNGAGKTTVTFILCGLYSPDSGTVNIFGYDIRTDMYKIRTSIGFCPQNNILYDDLTVYEHLNLIASIKDFPRKQINIEIKKITSYVGLQNDLNKKSSQLSGGMKRRLSVAMALIGDSKLIILDEPTSGLDPFNRRLLWDLIRNYKSGRTIIISTHYMEEADALSDRIALVNHGKVKCCGSPLFLKNKFGSGYRLTLTKDVGFNQLELEHMVQNILGQEAIIQSNIARELCLSIPNELSPKLPELLSKIDYHKIDLGILNYGISSATVEEVFLKIGSIDVDEKLNNKNLFSSNLNKSTSGVLKNLHKKNSASLNDKTKGLQIYYQQIKSLIKKRFYIFTRRYVILIFTLVLPVLIQSILSYMIPSTSALITQTIDTIFSRKFIQSFNLDFGSYGKLDLTYAIFGEDLKKQFNEFYENKKKTNSSYKDLSLSELDNLDINVDSHVYDNRKLNLKNMINNYYFGIEINTNADSSIESIIGLYSTLVYHSSATIINEIDSFLLAYYSKNLNKTIKCINSPISVGRSSAFEDKEVNLDNFQILNCIEIIPFSFLDYINSIIIAFVISVSTIHLTREKRNGSKSLQLLSGTHYIVYLISNYIFDFIIYLIQIISLVLAFKIVSINLNDTANDTVLISQNGLTLFYLFLFMLLTCFSWSTIAYIWSNFFKSDIIGFVVLFILLSFATLVDMICVILKFFASMSGDSGLMGKISNLTRNFLVIFFPNIALKRALFNLKLQNTPVCLAALNIFFGSNLKADSKGFTFSEPGIGKFLLLNYLALIFGIFVIFLIEDKTFQNLIKSLYTKKFVNPRGSNSELEEDVKNESERIRNSNIIQKAKYEEALVVSDLKKTFYKNGRPFSAVDNLSFGVLPTECFGLLGLNGAGKTTTIEILTGELQATSGVAFLNGFNVKTERLNAIKSLGFCPQFDYLPEFLTVKQTLELFANLRGIRPFLIESVIQEYLNTFKLNEFKDRLVQKLSGGNKRKVSSAIAFIGKPQTVILDEPTSGMDPAARRYLWNVIKHARDMGMTVLLTTHSMEECEALCTKLGIMVNGQFQCFGNIQHLKSKYGKGYSMILKCKVNSSASLNLIEEIVKNVENFITENIPNAVLKDRQSQTLFYQIIFENDTSFNLANIFSLIENNKETLNLETYSISQTTLEQVFLSFAKKQYDSNDQNLININQTNRSNWKKIIYNAHENVAYINSSSESRTNLKEM